MDSEAAIGDQLHPRKKLSKKRTGDTAPPSPSGSAVSAVGGCFDCNICLDITVDPVVTLCGHLYCWPCIYQWLKVDEGLFSHSSCPVCKASLSVASLVPLYGRGKATSPAKLQIPPRPSVTDPPSSSSPWAQQQPLHHFQHYLYTHYNGSLSSGGFLSPSSALLGGSTFTASTAGGLIGEMVVELLPLLFRSQQEIAADPMLRRQELKARSSLHQIWIFLSYNIKAWNFIPKMMPSTVNSVRNESTVDRGVPTIMRCS
ncbi:E3 ubiquitin-protein ligase RMA3 [Apostasia shenzhenica]|uniref:E3 ubiquitin-protein ligase RMA n=1 Tax=Apostasia shenzhenica TaxID=1088818 RepID=A0A2I0AXA7_9ASPA|nr:E3 ubiquitin-protein ligase RMA3 [Apostasia shenzhenica]